ncbi:MAG: DsrE family protein [Chloroflexi bacterium]|nr:DsrE family protein [Chloroflexota bacterium]
MKLAIQLLSGFGSQDLRTATHLAEAALALGHQVGIFLMEDAVYLVNQFKGLTDKGADVSLCAHNAHQRGVAKVDYILWGGQPDWAQMVHDADRVICLG